VAALHDAGDRLQGAKHLVLGGFQHNHVNLFPLVLIGMAQSRQHCAF
jgi:hypothetical protein